MNLKNNNESGDILSAFFSDFMEIAKERTALFESKSGKDEHSPPLPKNF